MRWEEPLGFRRLNRVAYRVDLELKAFFHGLNASRVSLGPPPDDRSPIPPPRRMIPRWYAEFGLSLPETPSGGSGSRCIDHWSERRFEKEGDGPIRISGRFVAECDGDFDGNGTVQFPDFVILANNFGKSATAVAPVPKPNTAMLLLVGLVGLVRRRRIVSESRGA